MKTKKTKRSVLGKAGLGLGLAGALMFISGCATNNSPSSGDQMKPMKAGEHSMMPR